MIAQKKSIRLKTLAIVVISVSMLLTVANIVASNAVATTGKRLQLLQQQSSEVEAQNIALEQSIGEKRSLSYIEAKAKELGLMPINETISLTTPESLAQAP